MGAFISKQPNGLYCRFSTIVDTVTHYNMTKEDYIAMCMERARKEAIDTIENYSYDFDSVLDCFHPNNESVEEFTARLKEMGVEDDKIQEFYKRRKK